MEKNFKQQLILIAVAAASLFFVLNIRYLYAGVNTFLGMLSPIVLGLLMAFIFNVPMKHMEKQLEKVKVPKSFRRGIAILGVLFIFIAIMVAISWIIVPTLANTVVQLGESFNYLMDFCVNWIQTSGWLQATDVERITGFINQSNIVSSVVSLLGGFTSNITGIFSNVFTILMAVFLMLNILGSKEQLQYLINRLLKVILPENRYELLQYIGKVTLDTYDKFLMGQLIEAMIIGSLVFVTYSVFQLPYAAITGVLAGVLSFIPYIGPFSACMLGAIFIFTVSPIQALISIGVFYGLQLIEGNFIYPRVVGNSIGLPTVLTLAAALIGGNLFGILGLVFFTPFCAVLYHLVKELVIKREEALKLLDKRGENHRTNVKRNVQEGSFKGSTKSL